MAEELNWGNFRKGVTPRFAALPIHEFEYRITYVPIILAKEQRDYVADRVVNAVMAGVGSEPACDLTALRFIINQSPEVKHGPRGEDSYIAVDFPHPVFDFGFKMGPTTLLITKINTPMEDLLRTAHILDKILLGLFPAGDGEKNTSLADVQLPERALELSVSFEHQIRLGRYLGKEEEEARNLSLLEKLARLDLDSRHTESTPLAALQPEEIRRGDVSLLFNKTIRNRARQVRIEYEGPWNVTQKDVDVGVSYRMGGSTAPLQPKIDLCDLNTPFFDFYRDIILKRFFADLFYSVEVNGRVPK